MNEHTLGWSGVSQYVLASEPQKPLPPEIADTNERNPPVIFVCRLAGHFPYDLRTHSFVCNGVGWRAGGGGAPLWAGRRPTRPSKRRAAVGVAIQNAPDLHDGPGLMGGDVVPREEIP